MKISKILTEKVNLSLNEPFGYFGVSLSYLPYGLVKIISDEHNNEDQEEDQEENQQEYKEGYGEAPLAWDVTGETQDSFVGAMKIIEKHLVGKDINCLEDVKEIMNQINKAIAMNSGTKWAVETALLDLLGQKTEKPIWALFQEVCLNQNISSPYILAYNQDVEQVKKKINKILSEGYSEIKVKVGKEEKKDLEILSIIREKSPKIKISVDANGSWKNVKEALLAIQKFEPFNLEWIEQPLEADDFWGLKEIKEKSNLKIMADESAKTYHDCKVLIEMKAVDLINIKLAKCGGMIEGLKIAKLCQDNNIGIMVGSMIESSIGTAANLHFSSLINHITTNIDALSYLKEDLAEGIIKKNKETIVPNVPGLGVNLKWKK